MARCQLIFKAPPDTVFRALADAEHYDTWLVGAKDIRAVDSAFPEPGAELHHTVGAGPVELKDSTEVEAVDTNRRLRLRARVRPLGVARVEFQLEPAAGGGTQVIMDEVVTEPALARALNPLLGPLINSRNLASLKNLREQVDGPNASHDAA